MHLVCKILFFQVFEYFLVNKANLVQNLFLVYSQYICQSLHVSGDSMPIIRRNNSVYATLVTCYSVWMTVRYAGCIPDSHPHRITIPCIPDSHPHRITIPCIPDSHPHRITVPCIPDSHPHRITSSSCHINTVVSPDDGHIVARNMQRLTNILRINCAPSWPYLQGYIQGCRSTEHKKVYFVVLVFKILAIGHISSWCCDII